MVIFQSKKKNHYFSTNVLAIFTRIAPYALKKGDWVLKVQNCISYEGNEIKLNQKFRGKENPCKLVQRKGYIELK
jgi:hypothetical protein